ncbi:MAG: hypothetical protein IJ945_09610 [Oscillospiraceae bacterium]|nr:hypothetical protein [Oscillospiraceae bacterium]
MKIKVLDTEENKRFSLWIPTHLIFNSFFAYLVPFFAAKELKKYRIKLNGKTCRKFVKALYKSRRHFGGKIELVEVLSKEGDHVKIVL